MKHKRNQQNPGSAAPQPVPVRFEFTHPTALGVSVAGTFNDWQLTTGAMYSSGDGRWLKETELVPGIYEYCLVVDGQWMPDPLARESASNPFGGRNSILSVAESSAAAHLTDAENLPFTGANK